MNAKPREYLGACTVYDKTRFGWVANDKLSRGEHPRLVKLRQEIIYHETQLAHAKRELGWLLGANEENT